MIERDDHLLVGDLPLLRRTTSYKHRANLEESFDIPTGLELDYRHSSVCRHNIPDTHTPYTILQGADHFDTHTNVAAPRYYWNFESPIILSDADYGEVMITCQHEVFAVQRVRGGEMLTFLEMGQEAVLGINMHAVGELETTEQRCNLIVAGPYHVIVEAISADVHTEIQGHTTYREHPDLSSEANILLKILLQGAFLECGQRISQFSLNYDGILPRLGEYVNELGNIGITVSQRLLNPEDIDSNFSKHEPTYLFHASLDQ